jgi:hypothetical protein
MTSKLEKEKARRDAADKAANVKIRKAEASKAERAQRQRRLFAEIPKVPTPRFYPITPIEFSPAHAHGLLSEGYAFFLTNPLRKTRVLFLKWVRPFPGRFP